MMLEWICVWEREIEGAFPWLGFPFLSSTAQQAKQSEEGKATQRSARGSLLTALALSSQHDDDVILANLSIAEKSSRRAFF